MSKPTSRRGFLAELIVCFLLSSPAWARYSLSVDRSGGQGISGFYANGSVDFAPCSSTPYEILLSYGQQHSTIGTPTDSKAFMLGWSHIVTDLLESHLSLTYWHDTLNNVHYAGPTFGLTGFLRTGGVSGPDAWMAGPPHDIAAISVNADVFVYGTEISVSSTTQIVFDSDTNQYIVKDIPANTGDAHTTQLHPHIAIDLLWFDQVKPYLMAGHYFYSRDPKSLEDIVGLPRFEGAGWQIGGLTAGFLSDSGEVGLRIPLPWSIEVAGYIGAARSQTFHDWSTVQGASLKCMVFKYLSPKIAWDRSLQVGITTDVITGGLSWTY